MDPSAPKTFFGVLSLLPAGAFTAALASELDELCLLRGDGAFLLLAPELSVSAALGFHKQR